MADEQYVLADGAAPHYHDGEPVGTEPFTPTDAERAMLGDLLIPVHDEDTDDPDSAAEAGGSDGGNATAEDDLTDLDGVGGSTADNLSEAGFETFADIREASVDDLAAVGNVSESDAEGFHDQLAGAEE